MTSIFARFGSSPFFFRDKGMLCSYDFVIFPRDPFFKFEFDSVSPFWPGRLLNPTVLFNFSFPVAFTVRTVGLSTFSVFDRRYFTLLAKGFAAETPTLVARSGQRFVLLLLLKILAVTGRVAVLTSLENADPRICLCEQGGHAWVATNSYVSLCSELGSGACQEFISTEPLLPT